MRTGQSPIILAIDTPILEEACGLVKRLGNLIGGIKLGLEFFCANGPVGVCQVMEVDDHKPLMLDLKLYDIPATVNGAIKALLHLEPHFLTLHCGDPNMMAAAVRAANSARNDKWQRPSLLGVTVLTSEEADPETVLEYAIMANESGLDGVVCSPLEVKLLRSSSKIRKDFILAVPGIRPLPLKSRVEADDQRRTESPEKAIADGADWLVIGRPITASTDPVRAAKKILNSLNVLHMVGGTDGDTEDAKT